MFLPDFIAKDWLRKCVALFFAVLIWYVVDQQLHEFEHFRNIPVEIQTEDGFIVINKGTQFVTVKLRGPESELRDISSPDIKVSVYLPAPEKTGQIQQPIAHEDITLPRGVKVDKVIPPRITVDIDRIETKREVPVRIVTSGKLSPTLKEIEDERVMNPQTVDITGPSRLIEGIDSVQTDPEFFDSKVIGSYEKNLYIAKQVPLVKASPEKVTVSFKIEEINSEDIFRDLTISLLKNESETGLKLSKPLPQLDQVTLQGPKAALKKITLDKIKTFIDISGIKEPGRHKRPVQVWLSDPEVKVIFASPSEIDVELEKLEEVIKEVPVPVEVDPKVKEIEKESDSLIKKDEKKDVVDPKLLEIEAESKSLIKSDENSKKADKKLIENEPKVENLLDGAAK